MASPVDTSRRVRAIARRLRLVPQADESAAAVVLGPEHELVDVLARRRALSVQILVTSIPIGLAAIGIARHVGAAAIVLAAAAAVQLALLVAVSYLRSRTRDIAEEIIASGNDAARALSTVEHERRRLASPKERRRLARSLERLVQDAERWPRGAARYQPPPGVPCLRLVVDDAREVVELLDTEPAGVRGIALTSRLLADGGASPLYGTDPEPLREELRRIRYLLVAPRHRTNDRLAA